MDIIMSKKNRRKTLTKKEGMIRKGEFSIDDSKVYIVLTIVMFHILPLVLVMMGEKGQEVSSGRKRICAEGLLV